MKTLRVQPYPYQREGIRYGLQKRRLIIGDEPGLGKTLQSIGIVSEAQAFPCLVICPSSLKINWQREWEKITDKKALVLDDGTRTAWPYLLQMHMQHVAIVNYESLRKYFVWDIQGMSAGRGTASSKSFRLKDVVFCPHISIFRSIIIDESHRVKDPTAQQTIFTKGIAAGKPYIILLSGTPVINQPEDLIAQLSIMERLNDFGGKQAFLDRYCSASAPAVPASAPAASDAVTPASVPAASDAVPSPLADLSARLYATCLIRREKKDVLTDLPAKTRCDLYIDISNREEYNAASRDLAAYLREYTECTDADIRRKMRMEALVRFMTLRSLSAKGKVAQAVDFINTFLSSGKSLIVFASYHEVVDAICAAFPQAVRVTGRDSAADKQAAVDAFQNGNSHLIVCSIKAAGVGLTLTAASNVAFIELPWTYADCCQCEDRAHRIGQRDNVTCYYLLGRRTIDAALYTIIHRKASIANQIMACDDDIPTSEAYFDQLVASLFNDSPVCTDSVGTSK